MSSNSQDRKYHTGEIVPFHLSPGIVVAAFFVSLLGSVTGVELLHCRTPGKKFQRLIQLAACASTLGLVAIWCMHFIGNLAIVMGSGQLSLQLTYSSSLAAVSSIIPVTALFVALRFADLNHAGKYRIGALTLCGIVFGSSIVGMHYVGTIAVEDYEVSYIPSYVLGSVCIALVCGLSFFLLSFLPDQVRLQSALWRLTGATLFAVAVTSFQFEASLGTVYRLKHSTNTSGKTYLIAIVLCLSTIPIWIGILYYVSKKKKEIAQTTQQVVMACTRFDERGRLMLNSDGLLPSQTIAPNCNHNCMEEDFDASHPEFQWAYQVSHCWSSVERFIPQMRSHLKAAGILGISLQDALRSSTTLLAPTSTPNVHAMVFREAFCIAADDLRREVGEPLFQLGTLYDDVVGTGRIEQTKGTVNQSFIRRIVRKCRHGGGIPENNNECELVARGQLLILLSHCDKESATRLSMNGYQFVPIERALGHLAKTLRTPVSYLAFHLDRTRKLAIGGSGDFPNSVLLGCFALRPRISKKGWQILVQGDQPNRLPFIPLPKKAINDREQQLLHELDGTSVTTCISLLESVQTDPESKETPFATVLLEGIKRLSELVAEPFFQQAILCSKIFEMPVQNPLTDRVGHRSIILFHVIRDIHDSSLRTTDSLEYGSYKFFKQRQQVWGTDFRYGNFQRKLCQEFTQAFLDVSSASPKHKAHGRSTSLDAPGILGFSQQCPNSSVCQSLSSRIKNVFSNVFRPSSTPHESDNGGAGAQGSLPFTEIPGAQDSRIGAEPPWEQPESSSTQIGDGSQDLAGIYPVGSTWVDSIYQVTIENWQNTNSPRLSFGSRGHGHKRMQSNFP